MIPLVTPLRYTISFNPHPKGWVVQIRELQSNLAYRKYYITAEFAKKAYLEIITNLYRAKNWRIVAANLAFTAVEWTGDFSEIFDYEKSRNI